MNLIEQNLLFLVIFFFDLNNPNFVDIFDWFLKTDFDYSSSFCDYLNHLIDRNCEKKDDEAKHFFAILKSDCFST